MAKGSRPEGSEGQLFARLLRRGAVGAAAEMLGAARRCLDMAVGYAKVREQFDARMKQQHDEAGEIVQNPGILWTADEVLKMVPHYGEAERKQEEEELLRTQIRGQLGR